MQTRKEMIGAKLNGSGIENSGGVPISQRAISVTNVYVPSSGASMSGPCLACIAHSMAIVDATILQVHGGSHCMVNSPNEGAFPRGQSEQANKLQMQRAKSP